MDFLPQLKVGLSNQWILLMLYAAIFLIFVPTMPTRRRQWLFKDSMARIQGWKKGVLRFGQLVTFAFLLMICMTPLPFTKEAPGIIGSLLHLCGLFLIPISLRAFSMAPESQPVASGPYRFSRNPQWVGL